MNLEKKISKRNLTRLIDSRKKMLIKKYFTTLEDIEKYAEDSVSPIYYMILEDSGVKNVNADHAASHLGKAQGLVNMLRFGSSLFLIEKNLFIIFVIVSFSSLI